MSVRNEVLLALEFLLVPGGALVCLLSERELVAVYRSSTRLRLAVFDTLEVERRSYFEQSEIHYLLDLPNPALFEIEQVQERDEIEARAADLDRFAEQYLWSDGEEFVDPFSDQILPVFWSDSD